MDKLKDQIQTLFDTVKSSPKKLSAAISKLFGKLGPSAMTGTEKIELPEKYANVVKDFNSGAVKNKKPPKLPSVGTMMKDIQAAKKTVSVEIDKGAIKDAIVDGTKELGKAEGETLKESFSLLDDNDEYISEEAGALLVTAVIYLPIYACYLYIMYVCYLASTHNVLLGTDDDVPGFWAWLGNMVLAGLPIGNLIWAIMLHKKILEKSKAKNSLKESYEQDPENDSIVSMMEDFSDETGRRLAINDANHDTELIEAYRKVIADLSRRVPKVIDPMDD